MKKISSEKMELLSAGAGVKEFCQGYLLGAGIGLGVIGGGLAALSGIGIFLILAPMAVCLYGG